MIRAGVSVRPDLYVLIYGIYGISVFAVRDTTLDELAQNPPMVRFGQVTLSRVGELRSAELRVDPTGRNPLHTVVFDELDTGIARLCQTKHDVWENPYYEE